MYSIRQNHTVPKKRLYTDGMGLLQEKKYSYQIANFKFEDALTKILMKWAVENPKCRLPFLDSMTVKEDIVFKKVVRKSFASENTGCSQCNICNGELLTISRVFHHPTNMVRKMTMPHIRIKLK